MATHNSPVRFSLLPNRQSITNLFLLLAPPTSTTNTDTNTNTTSSTSHGAETSGYRISLGLVEISALATLIGAINAESLSLGLASACGLPWATISTFGTVHVVKVSLAAVLPSNIREGLGLRSSVVDSAVGMSLCIDTTKAVNLSFGGPCAVLLPYKENELECDRGEAWSSRSFVGEKVPVPCAVYAFEKSMASVLESVPSTDAELVEIYQPPEDKVRDTVVDYAVVLASLGKVVEVYTLWRVGATTIWWITGLAWLHGFVSALWLQIAGLGRGDRGLGQVDVVAGELPSSFFPGGSRKVLLGLPGNVRRHYGWTIVWGTAAIVNLVAVLCTYVYLGTQDIETVYVWTGFQVLWLLARFFVYNFLAARHTRRAVTVPRQWETMRVGLRKRVVNLILALAKQQITIHPRGVHAYQEDLVDGSSIAGLFQKAENRLTESLPLGTTSNSSAGITIVGIIGDTVLRSTAWVRGVSLNNPDLYDCVLAFVSISGSIYAVPSVRVLFSIQTVDIEGCVPRLEPRGTTNHVTDVSWRYWVPAVDKILGSCWLEVTGTKVTGGKMAVLTREELGAKLASRTLNISLTTTVEVEAVLKECSKGSEVLLEVLMGAGVMSARELEGIKSSGTRLEVRECTPEI